jgi:hypothetical protein
MRFRSVTLLIGLVVILPQSMYAQGIFEAFGFPKPIVATGHTEVVGSVHLALRQGVVVTDTLVIDLSPSKLTNANPADIRITTSGNITTGAVVIDAENGRIQVPVNGGGNAGSFRVDGIRLSVAGTNTSSVSAGLSWAGRQNVLLPRETVVVVDQVQSGLEVDPVSDNFFVFNSTVVDSTATIVLREGFNTAFVSGADFGQNTPTRIRVRVTDFPTGLRMHFPATVTAVESGATLTTVEGTEVTVPRNDGGTDVTYNFNPSGNSAAVRESFTIPFTVSTSGRVSNLQPTIEISLAPIGAAIPTEALPATNIPRFAEENLVALEGTSRIITKTLYWTGIDNSRQNRLFIFNPSSTVANVTISALNPTGQLLAGVGITNSIRVSLAANQSSDKSLTDLFGAAASGIATVRVQSTGRDVVALGATSAAGLSEATPLLERGIANFVLPAVGEAASLHLFNPGGFKVSGTLTLRTPQGSVVATKPIDLESMSALTSSVQDLFSTNAQGQIAGSFNGPIVAIESFGTGTTLNFVPAQVPAGQAALFVPFFATGGGYETDLNIINSSGQTVTVTAQAFDSAGLQTSSARQITLSASEQLSITIAQLFQMQQFASGYIRIQVPQVARGFWTFHPAISGHARIRLGQSSSTVLPISGYPHSDSSILASGVAAGQFQGIALVNPTSDAVTVTMHALTTTGVSLGTATVSLAGGQISSKLIGEYFSVAIPERSVIRITSTAPIIATSITGSLNGDMLRATPALR